MQHHESALNTVRNNEDCKAGDGEEISGEIYYTQCFKLNVWKESASKTELSKTQLTLMDWFGSIHLILRFLDFSQIYNIVILHLTKRLLYSCWSQGQYYIHF